MKDLLDSAADARSWIEANREVVDEAYQVFLRSGEWPTSGPLQRHFDRLGRTDIDVRRVIETKPVVSQEARQIHQDYLPLHLRDLMWVNAARPLVAICVRAVQLVVRSYLSDDEHPHVSSDDGLVDFPSRFEGDFRLRVYKILTTEHPSPFAGSRTTGDDWSIDADDRYVRRFKDIISIGDFIGLQDVLRAEFVSETATLAVTFASMGEVLSEATVERIPDQAVLAVDRPAKPILFLSWGRSRSKAVAKAMRPILAKRLPDIEVFFSPMSIEPGSDPGRRMFEEALLPATALIVVLTPASANSAYVIWETAAAWARNKLVVPIFVDIQPNQVPGPLTQRAQGVHLNERVDVDWAIGTVASRFGIDAVDLMTDEEYATLEAAAFEGDDEPLNEPGPAGSDDWSVSVSQVGDLPVRLLVTDDEIKQFIGRERKRLLKPLEEEEARQRRQDMLAKSSFGASAFGMKGLEAVNTSKWISALAGVAAMVQETRTPEQFREEVNRYLEKIAGVLRHIAALHLIRANRSDLELEVQNRTTHNLDSVCLELYFSLDCLAFGHPSAEKLSLPRSPEPWGPRLPLSKMPTVPSLHVPHIENLHPQVSRDADHLEVIFPPVNLRSERSARLAPLALVSFGRDAVITVEWKATTTTFGRECSGEIALSLGRAVALEEALTIEVED